MSRCATGPWGRIAAWICEKLRRAEDFDHWASFGRSFRRLFRLIREVGSPSGDRPPASIVMLSGDVHHAYLAEVAFPRGSNVESHVYQAVCSPYRNPLSNWERRAIRLFFRKGSRPDHPGGCPGGRRLRPGDRLAVPRGPLLRQPGGDPDAGWAVSEDQAREDGSWRSRRAGFETSFERRLA